MQMSKNECVANTMESSNNNGTFTQFIADNVDHNVRTLDEVPQHFPRYGNLSASIVDSGSSISVAGRIPRLSTRPSVADVCKNSVVPVVAFDMRAGSGIGSLTLKSIRSLQSPSVLPPVTNLKLICPARTGVQVSRKLPVLGNMHLWLEYTCCQ